MKTTPAPEEAIDAAADLVDTGRMDIKVGWDRERGHVVIGLMGAGETQPRFALSLPPETAKGLAEAILLEVRVRKQESEH